jgi:hypothetical protein
MDSIKTTYQSFGKNIVRFLPNTFHWDEVQTEKRIQLKKKLEKNWKVFYNL